jgi:transcriptional regulator with XRE-family HTH domain
MDKEQLGAYIAENRKAVGLTQQDLAERLHVTNKAVSKWERGLSYPDVTLLEPLAKALDLGVEELMACRRQAVTGEEKDTMKALLDISNASVRAEKKRGWSRLIGLLVLLLVTGMVILYAVSFRSVRNGNAAIVLKETADGTNWIYITEPLNDDHLLRLKCGKDVDFDALELADQWGEAYNYRLSFRWNRWTRQGKITACEQLGTVLGGMADVSFEEESAQLFGYSEVFYTTENYYQDPYNESQNRVFLCDAKFWTGNIADRTDRTVLLVEDCLSAVVYDWDGDGENEVVARNRWPEKPYTVYDYVDGKIVEVWPDTVSEELQSQLRCMWEQ